ncbi:MAG TPA: undecaprenyl/decaprenyl-phosphate alpha-N-acetylglucosaminyl 1-phosphate transferase [Candidatus Faecenecus gallistercoris]|uniref:Undecaprenyl/decaprenyl-phosphate alpha-N-acetylglucosaminyl 1-phosphate transferase n=1 Tax=Candidatus Faecenecus gallistercoris TaxID=2840793 RepID=A0A9D0YYN1_9FIRM|nr:MAG: undecaprenyl/decaprenyl-phosphate alpha-N-acetylglucosaminyl 1-phosphate transferase [Bacillota bacterium]CDE08853.1 glycosyl transferase group 4 family protein [Bacillus sp. CAG:988]HIQ64392.1 undecaprenyl/decaprenyl-phosphate alpha-N-acetylglucosaminyl 1-phosphate transferase [Candidatus Faecenecus gallistercoris]
MFGNTFDNVIRIVLTTFIFSAAIMPVMKRIAHHIGAVDVPRSTEGNRHIHNKPIPKLGGLGIFLGFLFGYMCFGVHSLQMNSILIGSFIIILTGIIDDIHDLRASYKLIGQLAAASVIVFYGGILLDSITVFGLPEISFGIWAYPITIFFIIACVNIINLIDGLDGLSGGISSIFYLTAGIICIYQGRTNSLEMLLTFIMLGSTLGFLLHNFYPAKIFAGDCSQFMGFIIAIISLLGFKGMAFSSIFVPLLILAIPTLDTLFAIIRRLLQHRPIFSPDKQHLHHQFLKMKFSQRKTVLIIYFIDILFALASIFYVLKDPVAGRVIYIVLALFVLWLVTCTDIITDKRPIKFSEVKEKVRHKSRKKR